MEQNKILKKYWGYEDFRWNQSDAIKTLLNWKNIVYIAKTGDWKSICYQIPAIIKDWLTIIVSPLKSLMKDQVESLEKLWVKATFLNSDLTSEESKFRFSNLMNWEYKMLYVSPEKLSWETFIDYLKEVPWGIDYFIIDEFDTVDEYGSSWFRPEYLNLWNIKDELQESQSKKITVWIFTATATAKVEWVVAEMMNIENDYKIYRGLLIWKNLKYEIKKYDSKEEKDKYLYSYIKEIDKQLTIKNGTGIIFCTTTKDVDNLYKLLKDKFEITRFHGKMTAKMKESSFNKFMNGKVKLIVCTNAFWRWVDKKNIRYILHYWIPGNISSYLQEIWRWWRDWSEYNAITLYSGQDINRRKFLASWKREQLKDLKILLEFLEDDKICRTQRLHSYFWLDYKIWKCKQCDICENEHFIKIDENKLTNFKVKKIQRKKTRKSITRRKTKTTKRRKKRRLSK